MLNVVAPAPLDPVVFLLDVDNTLLDNDRFAADLRARLTEGFGAGECARYWSIYSRRREECGYADYLGTLQEFRADVDTDPDLLEMSAFLLDYPFAERIYPRALESVAHLRTFARPVILSDGDVVFQPRKIRRSGLWDAVDGRVLIYLHKERMLAAMEQRFPASHYVMVDDKPQLLAAMKRTLGQRLSTVFVKQGHYAAAAEHERIDPPPDFAIEAIGALCDLDLTHLVAASAPSTQESP